MERESHEGKTREQAAEAERSGKEQAAEEKAAEEKAGERKAERVTPRILAEQAVKRRRAERGT